MEIDIKKLTEEAVKHMEGVEDVRWSVGMALEELYGDEFVYAMQIELGKKYLQHTGAK
jgi:uncharacterized protein YcnI